MSITRPNEHFFPFTDLPSELQVVISQLLDKAALLRLASGNKALWRLLRHQIMNRFMASHRIIQVGGTIRDSFFVTTEGHVYACGENEYGELGVGDGEVRPIPVKVPNLSGITKAKIRPLTKLFLSEQGLVWQLDHEYTYKEALPFSSVAHLSMYRSRREREDVFALLEEAGEVYVARNEDGNQEHPEFRRVEELSNIKKVIMKYDCTFYINTKGQCYATGRNWFGELGLGHFQRYVPLTLMPPLPLDRAIKTIWSNGNSTFIQTDDDLIFACGYNREGQLGIGTRENTATPVFVPQLKKLKQVCFYRGGCYGLTHEGRIWVWGKNNEGHLGLGDQNDRLFPVPLESLSAISSIEIADTTLFFHRKNNYSYMHGKGINKYIYIAEGATYPKTPIEAPTLFNIKKACVGSGIFTFLRYDGTVVGWGDNTKYALGLPEQRYYSELQLIELSPVVEYISYMSPAVLIHYANQGHEHYHQVCFDMALKKLQDEMTLENIQDALPLLLRKRRGEEREKQLFPGYDGLSHSMPNELLTAYAHLLLTFTQLQGTRKFDVEQQARFVSVLQSEEKEEIVARLRRFGFFTNDLKAVSSKAIQQAAEILSPHLPAPLLLESKRAPDLASEDDQPLTKRAKQ